MTTPSAEAGRGDAVPAEAGASPAGVAAEALLAEFVRRGVRDVVLSPGSRSQALALAAARLEAAGALRLRVRIDERVGSFLALGLAVETGVPVLMITTSGTAVANLHPAVLEASHSGVPIILITADRPDELLGTGANQTTVQSGIFGGAVRLAIDAPAPGPDDSPTDVAAAAIDLASRALDAAGDPLRAGPVHLNVAYREPLSGGASDAVTSSAEWQRAASGAAPLELRPEPHTVVVAGAGAGPAAEQLARELAAPLLAEVASGARFGPNLVPAYQRMLDESGFGDAVERVIVVGHPTLTRQVPALIARQGVQTVVVRGPGRDDYDPGHRVDVFADAVTVSGSPDEVPDARAWVGRWVFASRSLLAVEEPSVASLGDDLRERAGFARKQLARMRAAVTRRELVEAVWGATWPHDRLVLGASRLIREADSVVTGKRLRVHANRGLAGIDGTISTAIGIALASQSEPDGASGTTRVLLGDLALLHDVGALLFGTGEPRPRIQVVVGNDGGGTIFDDLEVAGTAEAELFDRVLLTPQRVDLAALAAAYDWDYRRVDGRGDLDQALTATVGPMIIEVPLPR